MAGEDGNIKGHFHVKVDMGVKISSTSESSKFGLKWKLKVYILII